MARIILGTGCEIVTVFLNQSDDVSNNNNGDVVVVVVNVDNTPYYHSGIIKRGLKSEYQNQILSV
jgi:CRISPR/Cas system endoribonuclease Cas6 (RAMP superfamily)